MVLTQILVVHISGCTIVLSKSCFHPQLFIIPWNHGGKVCEVVWSLSSLVTVVSAINVTHNFCSDKGIIFTFNHQYAYSPYCCVYILWGAFRENLFNNQQQLLIISSFPLISFDFAILAKEMFWSYINEMLNVKRKKKQRGNLHEAHKWGTIVYFILKIKKMNTSIYFLCYLLILLFCKIIRLGGGKS